jgi:hypothetical protein
MSITNWTDLQTEVASNSNRSDLTALIPTFIQLAEAEMQRELKLSELETSASVSVTAGIGALPTGYAGARALYWDGDRDQALSYVTPDRYNSMVSSHTGGTPRFYTVQGNQLKTLPQSDGTVVMQYLARFTPLSGTNATNAIITNYPDAYFFGTLMFLYHHTRNWVAKAEQRSEMMRVLASIKKDQQAKKYPGPLEVRPA